MRRVFSHCQALQAGSTDIWLHRCNVGGHDGTPSGAPDNIIDRAWRRCCSVDMLRHTLHQLWSQVADADWRPGWLPHFYTVHPIASQTVSQWVMVRVVGFCCVFTLSRFIYCLFTTIHHRCLLTAIHHHHQDGCVWLWHGAEGVEAVLVAAPSWELANAHELAVGAVCGSNSAQAAVVQYVEALGQARTWVFVLSSAPEASRFVAPTADTWTINPGGMLLFSWKL